MHLDEGELKGSVDGDPLREPEIEHVDAATAFSGIAEDTAGYRGSKDWTRFYAVIYQAQPFIFKSELKFDMKRIGATTWKTFLVDGDMKPRNAATRLKSPDKHLHYGGLR
jgi:hypothetical protein